VRACALSTNQSVIKTQLVHLTACPSHPPLSKAKDDWLKFFASSSGMIFDSPLIGHRFPDDVGSASTNSRLFEIARVLVRFDHVARFIVKAGDGVIWAAGKPGSPQPLLLSGSTSTGGWPPRLCKSNGSRPELGDGKLPGWRLQRGDGISQFH
jgi:hypothetical protein